MAQEALSADEEEEMGPAGATAEDAETEFTNRMAADELVTGTHCSDLHALTFI